MGLLCSVFNFLGVSGRKSASLHYFYRQISVVMYSSFYCMDHASVVAAVV